MKKIFQSAVFYFALVFTAGFLLGTVRVLFIVPKLGARTSELLEAPLMLLVSWMAARWVVRRLAVAPGLPGRLGMGGLALVFMLAAEFGLVLWLRGISLRQYFATRDPVAGAVYYIALGVFAMLPAVVRR